MPKKPGDVELKVMKEMFEASVDGDAFDMDKWGQYFKPSGYGSNGNTTSASSSAVSSAVSSSEDIDPVVEEKVESVKAETAPVDTKPAEGSPASRAQDILAAIRNRNKQ